MVRGWFGGWCLGGCEAILNLAEGFVDIKTLPFGETRENQVSLKILPQASLGGGDINRAEEDS